MQPRYNYEEWETLVRFTHLSVMKFSVHAARADATTSATLEGCWQMEEHIMRTPRTSRNRKNIEGERYPGYRGVGVRMRPAAVTLTALPNIISRQSRVLFKTSFFLFFRLLHLASSDTDETPCTFEYFRNPWRILWIRPVLFSQKITAKIECVRERDSNRPSMEYFSNNPSSFNPLSREDIASRWWAQKNERVNCTSRNKKRHVSFI